MAKSFCPAHVWGDFLQTGGDLKQKSADHSFRGHFRLHNDPKNEVKTPRQDRDMASASFQTNAQKANSIRIFPLFFSN
jgi:hypothetical protein